MGKIKELLMASPELLWIPRRVWEIGRATESTEISLKTLGESRCEFRLGQVFDELQEFQFDSELIQFLGRYGYKENFLNFLQRWKWSASNIEGPEYPLMRTNYFSEVLLRELSESYM